jgi:hypothetical protein
VIAPQKRVLKFNAKWLDGATQGQQDILAGVGTCGAKYGTRAVKATPCDAPLTWLEQDGRRRWVILGFCELHGGLTKEMNERERAYVSWARLADVLPEVKKIAEVSK